MALAEKWRLTLDSTNKGSQQDAQKSSSRRKSVLTGVDTTGLFVEPSTEPSEHIGNDEQEKACEAEEQVMMMPSMVVMEDDYFHTDAQEKVQLQIQNLTDKTQKVAQQLPINNFIVNQSLLI